MTVRGAAALVLTGLALTLGVSGGEAAPSRAAGVETTVTCSRTVCEALVRNVWDRPFYLVGLEVPAGKTVSNLTSSDGSRCVTRDNRGTCSYRSGDQATFPAGGNRTVTFTSTPALERGAEVLVCASARTDGGDAVCTTAAVVLTESDLEIKFSVRARARLKKGNTELTYRFVITNHGPSTSPGWTVRLRVTHAGVLRSPTLNERFRDIRELHSGDTWKYAWVRRVNRLGRYSSVATVAGSNPDPNLRNNRATRTTVVTSGG